MSQASGRVVFVLRRLRARQEWQFFAVLPKADPVLAAIWWALLLLNGAMPAIFAVAIGVTVGAVQQGRPVGGALALTGVVFVLMLILNPIQTAVSMNLGNKVSLWLNEALIRACVQPPGIGHLEDPDLADDLTTAREFDRGMTGPPMYFNVDFLATSLVAAVSGVASAVVLIGFAWWAAVGSGCGVGIDTLAAARERGLAGPEHSRSALRPAPRGLRLPTRRRSAAGKGAATLRPRRLDGRALHRAPQTAVRVAVPRNAAAGEVGALVHDHCDRSQRGGVCRPRL